MSKLFFPAELLTSIDVTLSRVSIQQSSIERGRRPLSAKPNYNEVLISTLRLESTSSFMARRNRTTSLNNQMVFFSD
jgi:hypothetical protein